VCGPSRVLSSLEGLASPAAFHPALVWFLHSYLPGFLLFWFWVGLDDRAEKQELRKIGNQEKKERATTVVALLPAKPR
jgi:hypothetical protein